MRSLVRSLTKNPGFTAVVVAVLALGVGANTAIFSVVNAVLLHPFPYPDSDRILFLGSTHRGDEGTMPVTYPDFQAFQHSAQSFDQLAFAAGRSATLTQINEPAMVTAASISASAWPLLGMAPQLGRVFTADEDQPAATPVCVLSYATWQAKFGADPAILTRSIMLDGRAYAVIGVMSPAFNFWAGDVWLPAGLDANTDLMQSRVMRFNSWMVGRPKPGVTIEAALAELSLIAGQIAQAHPDTNKDVGISGRLLRESVTGPFQQPLMMLLAAVAAVLLIACANVANLLLARTASRQREYAIRVALGATRGQLIRQSLLESVPLSLLGGLAGVLVGAWALQGLLALLPADAVPAEARIEVNLPVMLFSLTVVVTTMLVFSLFPALSGSRPQLSEGLQEGSRGTTNQRTARLRAGLIIAEVSLSLTLLVGAGLLVRSLQRLAAVDPGFDPKHLLMAPVNLPHARYATGDQGTAFFATLLEDVGRAPGVQSVAATTNAPFQDGSGMPLIVEGRTYASLDDLAGVQFAGVMGDYFRTQGLRLVRGRALTEQDREGTEPVIVLNEAAVKRFLPEVADPLGQRVLLGVPPHLLTPGLLPEEFSRSHWSTIVGVVENVRHFGLSNEDIPIAYLPVTQLWKTPMLRDAMTVLVRTTGDPLLAVGHLRSALGQIDRDQPVSRISTVEAVIGDSLRGNRFNTILLGLFAGVALLLAVVGIYGVVAWNVSQRTREIGIRQALGAQREDVLKLVVGQGMRVVLIGVAIGLATSLAVARALQSMLFEISAFDPWTFLVVGLLLAAVALLACFLPARRAARISPLEALRSD